VLADRSTIDIQAQQGTAFATNLNRFAVFSNYGFDNVPTQMWHDTVAFGYPSKRPLDQANDVPMGLISDLQYSWLGLMGLDERPTNFTMPRTPNQGGTAPNGPTQMMRSMLQVLKDAKKIPSLSWAYHAGSQGRE